MNTSNSFQAFFTLLIISILVGCNPSKEGETHLSEGLIESTDNVKLFYEFKGKGQDTIVMIHGGPGFDAVYMIADFEELSKDYVLLYYDQRGGGRSTLPDTTVASELLTIDKHVEDLEELRKYFGFNKMTLLAHSFGPMISTKYALKYPSNVEKLISIGSVPPKHWSNYKDATWRKNPLSKEERNISDSLRVAITQNVDPKENCKRYWELVLITRLASGLPIDIIKGDICSASDEAIWYGYKYTSKITSGSLGNWNFEKEIEGLTIRKRPTKPIFFTSCLMANLAYKNAGLHLH